MTVRVFDCKSLWLWDKIIPSVKPSKASIFLEHAFQGIHFRESNWVTIHHPDIYRSSNDKPLWASDINIGYMHREPWKAGVSKINTLWARLFAVFEPVFEPVFELNWLSLSSSLAYFLLSPDAFSSELLPWPVASAYCSSLLPWYFIFQTKAENNTNQKL